jgi:hypothetical protein
MVTTLPSQRIGYAAILVATALLAVHWSIPGAPPQRVSQQDDALLRPAVAARRNVHIDPASAWVNVTSSPSSPACFPSLAASRAQRKIPPLLRLGNIRERQSASTESSHRARNTDNRDVIREAYRGEYGWRFKEYISSNLEVDFYDDVRPFVNDHHWPALVKKYQAKVEKLLAASVGRVALNDNLVDSASNNMLEQCDSDDGKPFTLASTARCFGNATTQSEFSPELFSRFVYEFVCLGEPCNAATFPAYTGWRLGQTQTSFIEPLFATMRHPKFFLTEGVRDFLEDKEYMVVDKWALHHLHTRWKKRFFPYLEASLRHYNQHVDRQKSIFVDMGASVYFRGQGGASQKWFVGVTDCLCIPFTDMFLFEAKLRSPPLVWSSTPGHLHPNYYWFNYPLEVASSSWRNPFNHLLQKLRPDDVVTVKVDFDSPGLEMAIIRTILQVPELYQTIDELFYEYHVKMAYMHRYWPSADAGVTVRDSIDVFRTLRQRGIRAHSWV